VAVARAAGSLNGIEAATLVLGEAAMDQASGRATVASGLASIGVGKVLHARRRPAAHRFGYSAWFLRLPLRALESRPWPWRWLRRNGAGLAAINDADHGDGRPLLQWIADVLARGGVRDADGEIFLHTFPRVLGYVFNPVSFWFAHRADGSLRAVVCEVNNTFGERHCYLLAHDDGRALRWGEELTATKVFHVSPFCNIEGRYRFRFLLARRDGEERFVARIDYDDARGALLATSIEGRLSPVTDRAIAQVLITRPLFTLGVIARIHWQALRLFAKRVPLFSKPQAPEVFITRSSSITRNSP
jgi:uncharacterized protein